MKRVVVVQSSINGCSVEKSSVGKGRGQRPAPNALAGGDGDPRPTSKRDIRSGTQKLADCRGDRLGVRLERKVPGVEETDIGLRDVTLESLGAGRQEEGVVLAPDRQETWPVRSEVVLKSRVKRHVSQQECRRRDGRAASWFPAFFIVSVWRSQASAE